MGTSNINKVIPSMVEKTPYMGCVPFDPKKALKLFEKGVHCVSEIKADGRYCNVIIRGGELEMESRAGEPSFIGDCLLTQELSSFDDCVLNGELVMKNLSRLESNGILASIIDYQTKLLTRTEDENLKKEETFHKEKGITIKEALSLVQLKVWDIIDIDSYYLAKSEIKRVDRLNMLKLLLNESDNVLIVEHRFVKSYEEAIAHFIEALERGEEGTVLKSLDGVWANGKPTHQIKMKVEFELDLKVVGFNYGNKGTKNEFVISSVSCESSCGKLTARAQGIKEDKMKYITENQNSLLGTIAVVKCNGLSSNSSGGNSLFYPSLIEFRDDKLEANSFDECVDIDAGAKGLIKIIKG
jgi:DNA ligase-1